MNFQLEEISNWQLDYDNSKVELPSLQRSFVWKANQIESLWDSILRGFPLGSFLLCKKDDGGFWLLDGQQRATSIAIGHYDPWVEVSEKDKFWSLKSTPILWIDLEPIEKTDTQKYVLRVVTQSHPWGYQRQKNNKVLSIADRRKALQNFHEIEANRGKKYTEFELTNAYPYDANLPVPFSFLVKSIQKFPNDWREKLIKLCEKYLPINHIKTKGYITSEGSYIERLEDAINENEFKNYLYDPIRNTKSFEIPGLVVKSNVLEADEDDIGDDATLFVRFNSGGTRIGGEELIYSIYKSSFPDTKNLVESIGINFMTPSLVISLVARLAWAEVQDVYPYPFSVNEFRKRIKIDKFRNKLKEYIGDETKSEAKTIFDQSLKILGSKAFNIPPVLVKNIVKGSPDLFLMLLRWVRLNPNIASPYQCKRIIATITALAWWGKNNKRYVRESWDLLSKKDFWSFEHISKPFYEKKDFLIHPFISPCLLRKYLMAEVADSNVKWNNLYPAPDHPIVEFYKIHMDEKDMYEQKNENIKACWDNFMNELFRGKSLVFLPKGST